MVERSLDGVRVLDLTRLLPGPYASWVLAELGAEVIKVEEPPLGDPLRHMPFVDSQGTSILFDLVNRGKKSITLNLKPTSGREIFLSLARRSDVLLESYRPGVMQRLGLGYDALAEVNPRLVYASLSGYGQTGSSRLRAGHDLNYIALAGLLGVTGTRDGAPVIPGVPVADLASALWAALSIAAALFARQSTRRGRFLDISMTESAAALLAVPLAEWQCAGRLPETGRMALTGGRACYNVYRTADGGHMTLAALEPQFWQAFCNAVGRPDWISRLIDADQLSLIAEVAQLFATQSRAEWTRFFANHDCCCEPVLDLDEASRHLEATARGLLRDGHLTTPVTLPGAQKAPAPALGQHNLELLRELGHSPEQVERWREEGIL